MLPFACNLVTVLKGGGGQPLTHGDMGGGEHRSQHDSWGFEGGQWGGGGGGGGGK